MPVADSLVWLDLEMTGPDPMTDQILEIGCVVTDRHLEVVAEGPNLVINQPDDVLDAMSPVVVAMHRDSGLLELVRASKLSVAEAQAQTLAFLRQHVIEGKAPLCGNTIWKDRLFLKRYMADLDRILHYRNVDVSTLKELVGRWYPAVEAPPKKKSHRALDDIRESIAELRFYRREIFVAP